MTPHETAVKIAEAIMDTIERRQGILKDDLIEAARGVLAGSMSGSSARPWMGLEAFPLVPPFFTNVSVVTENDGDIIRIGWKEK